MKKFLFILVGVLLFSVARAQYVLPVPVTAQEQGEWCWAGCTACIFHYYGDTIHQCEIADYTRTVATWHYYGSTPCCTDPAFGCNCTNQIYGTPGSIQDILMHFHGITNYNTVPLSLAQMDTCCAHYLPFIIYWTWVGSIGEGHVVVGNGVDTGGNVHYMNPSPGEGAHICTHTWMMYDGVHNYMNTQVLSTCPLTLNAGTITGPSTVAAGLHITLADTAAGGTWHCSNGHATVSSAGVVTGVSAGWDTVMYTVSNACGAASASWPVHITASSSSGTYMTTTVSDGLEVYPNPAKGTFHVKLSNSIPEPVRFTISDIIGRQVYAASAQANELITIQLDQPPGIYIISAITVHNTCTSKIAIER